MDELMEIVRDLKEIKEDSPLKTRAWELVEKIKEERAYREGLVKERKEIKKEIDEINCKLATKRISKGKINKKWDEWLRYCEINNIDEFTGIPKEENAK